MQEQRVQLHRAVAKANEQIQNIIGLLENSSVVDAFQGMEEKVLEMEAGAEDREMLRRFFEPRWETLIRHSEELLAAKLTAKTVQIIEARLQARLQAMAVLICWKEELATWKFHFLYWLILDRQQDLRQLRQVVDKAVVDRAVEAVVVQKLNLLQYRQVQRVAIRCQERAELALQKGNENWARKCLRCKNSVMKMASELKAILDEQTPLVDELRRKLKAVENKIADDEQTLVVKELKRKQKKLENKIAEFGILYCDLLENNSLTGTFLDLSRDILG
jgi:phage shock protein A